MCPLMFWVHAPRELLSTSPSKLFLPIQPSLHVPGIDDLGFPKRVLFVFKQCLFSKGENLDITDCAIHANTEFSFADKLL